MATATAASPGVPLPHSNLSWQAKQEGEERGPGCFDVVSSKNSKNQSSSPNPTSTNPTSNTNTNTNNLNTRTLPRRIRTDSDDPLTLALRPPPNEPPEARLLRLKADAEAEARSKAIDGEIAEARKGWERRKKGIKVLLLGQAESGKSTTLKSEWRYYVEGIGVDLYVDG